MGLANRPTKCFALLNGRDSLIRAPIKRIHVEIEPGNYRSSTNGVPNRDVYIFDARSFL